MASTLGTTNASDDAVRASVIIPAYNAARSIERALASALAQTEQDIEVVVIDDYSDDATPDIVKKLATQDSRVRLVRLDSNGGPSVARNRGIAEARGRWFAILDADDAYKADRLGAMIAFCEANGLDMVGDDLIYFDIEAGTEVGAGRFIGSDTPVKLTTLSYLASCSFQLSLRQMFLEDQRHLSLLKYVIRTGFIKDRGLRYRENLRYGEDFIFNFEVLKAGAMAMVMPEAFYIYSQQYGSLSKARSPLSHTIVDRLAIVRAVDELMERYPNLTSQERTLLQRRKVSALGLQEFERARDLVRQRRFARGLGNLFKHPHSLPFAVLETRRFAAKRLTSWSKSAGSGK
jgi:succinoglycan biosynthesis protein ExoO